MSPKSKLPAFLTVEHTHARFRPLGEFTLDAAAQLVDDALRYCRDAGIPRLLVNITGMSGFHSPTLTERFYIIETWARTAEGQVALSIVTPAEFIDPDKIGITIAQNRGMQSEVFADETEAVNWLIAV